MPPHKAPGAVDLPQQLLTAVTSDNDSQLTVVIGAGCSVEPPTSLPLSRSLAVQAYHDLVANGLIESAACVDPEDLSAVAAAVVAATGGQTSLVKALPRRRLRTAEPNRGHMHAAALLRERVIGNLVALNFDLAQTRAVAEICQHHVAIVNGPEFHDALGSTNLIYLHRNVDCQDPESWILTREAMRRAWEDGAWEAAIMRRSAVAPIVLFAGLGSPADVLEHSIREIRNAVQTEVFLAEPGDPATSPFFAALQIGTDRVIPMGWVDLMDALAERLAKKHRRAIVEACRDRGVREAWGVETWTAVEALTDRCGLLELGLVRATWTLQEARYLPATTEIAEQLADLWAVIELIAQTCALRPELRSNGVVTFTDPERRLRAAIGFVSGRGARSGAVIHTEIVHYWKYQGEGPMPASFVVTGVNGALLETSTPDDIATGQSSDDVIGGPHAFTLHMADALCQTRDVSPLLV